MKFSLHKKLHLHTLPHVYRHICQYTQLPFIHIFYIDVLVLKLLSGLPLLKYT